MGKHSAFSKQRLLAGLLLGTASSALAVSSLGSAGTADATCASISGLSTGAACTTTAGNAAIALGSATASAVGGMFNVAVASGNPGLTAYPVPGAFENPATKSVATTATAGGAQSSNNIALAIGNGTYASAGGQFNIPTIMGVTPAPGSNNVAAVFGNGSVAQTVNGDNNSSVVIGNNAFGAFYNSLNSRTAVINNPPTGSFAVNLGIGCTDCSSVSIINN